MESTWLAKGEEGARVLEEVQITRSASRFRRETTCFLGMFLLELLEEEGLTSTAQKQREAKLEKALFNSTADAQAGYLNPHRRTAVLNWGIVKSF